MCTCTGSPWASVRVHRVAIYGHLSCTTEALQINGTGQVSRNLMHKLTRFLTADKRPMHKTLVFLAYMHVHIQKPYFKMNSNYKMWSYYNHAQEQVSVQLLGRAAEFIVIPVQPRRLKQAGRVGGFSVAGGPVVAGTFSLLASSTLSFDTSFSFFSQSIVPLLAVQEHRSGTTCWQ